MQHTGQCAETTKFALQEQIAERMHESTCLQVNTDLNLHAETRFALQTDAGVDRSSSGGPLLDSSGHLVGVCLAARSDPVSMCSKVDVTCLSTAPYIQAVLRPALVCQPSACLVLLLGKIFSRGFY